MKLTILFLLGLCVFQLMAGPIAEADPIHRRRGHHHRPKPFVAGALIGAGAVVGAAAVGSAIKHHHHGHHGGHHGGFFHGK